MADDADPAAVEAGALDDDADDPHAAATIPTTLSSRNERTWRRPVIGIPSVGDAPESTSLASMTAEPSVIAVGLMRAAAESPHRAGLVDSERSLTFAEAEQLVTARTARLVASIPAGTRTPSLIPVLVDRTAASVLALHALVRAGRTFVPIDWAAPPARMHETFERIGSPRQAVVARAQFADSLPDGVEAVVLDDSARGTLEPQPVDTASAAYVIFTSGSTGRPKAVIRSWVSFDNRRYDQIDQGMCPPGAPWNAAILQPFTFSPGLRALSAMALGRTVHVVDPSSLSGQALMEWLAARDINEATFSATLFRTLLDSIGPSARIPTLRLLRFGSEASTWDLVEAARRIAAPDLVVTTGYGATEIGRSFNFRVSPGDPVGTGRIPIGRPRDPDGVRLEPVDGDPAVTQLVVRTRDSLGYLDDDTLNAARYRTDEHGGLWWSSGDIAIVDDGGTFHHRGRIDDMVKINGLLVEPAETERALASIPGIRGAAVLPEQRSSGKWRLVAHVCVDDPLLTPEAVRAHLLDTLPAHLVPSFLVRHDNLPFNSRNKLDREALRSRHRERWRSTAPRAIWDERALWLLGQLTEILDVEDLSVDDDIWNLGLDSLDAVEFCARIADAGFGEIEPPELLTHRTASAVAARMNRDGAEEHSPVVGFNPEGALPPIFAIPGGGGTALAFRSLAGALGTDQPLYVIEPLGLHQPHRPDLTVPALARSARLEIDRRHAHGAPVVVIGYSAGASAAYEIVRQLEQEGRSARLVLLDAAPGRAGRSGLGAPPAAPRPGHGSIPSPLARLRRRTRTRLVLDMPTMAVRWAGRTLTPRLRVLRLVTTGSTSATRRYRSDHYDAFRRITRRAVNRYRVEPIEAPVDLFAAEVGDAAARCRAVVGGVTVHQVAGDHFTMLQPPHVSGLAAALRALLSAG